VTGYYPAQNRIEPVASIPWSKYTEIDHFAAAAGVGDDGCGNGTVNLHYLTPAEMSQFVARAHALGKKAVVTIKDNDQHLEAFSQNTAPEVIEAFVSSIKALVISNAYDGVDIDWESKVTVGPYVNLLSQLRRALGEAKLITVAVGNWSQLDRVATQAQAQVDHINLRCYDMDDTRSYA
jgi:chitinase